MAEIIYILTLGILKYIKNKYITLLGNKKKSLKMINIIKKFPQIKKKIHICN